jgi:hypothetical protein
MSTQIALQMAAFSQSPCQPFIEPLHAQVWMSNTFKSWLPNITQPSGPTLFTALPNTLLNILSVSTRFQRTIGLMPTCGVVPELEPV